MLTFSYSHEIKTVIYIHHIFQIPFSTSLYFSCCSFWEWENFPHSFHFFLLLHHHCFERCSPWMATLGDVFFCSKVEQKKGSNCFLRHYFPLVDWIRANAGSNRGRFPTDYIGPKLTYWDNLWVLGGFCRSVADPRRFFLRKSSDRNPSLAVNASSNLIARHQRRESAPVWHQMGKQWTANDRKPGF